MDYNPLNFKCHQCGNCCRGDGQVFVSAEEISRMADHLDMNYMDFRIQYLTKYHNQNILKSKYNLDCIFLESDSSCKVHPVKPDQCKKWPYWPEMIHDEESFEDGQSYCEGLKEFEYKDFAALKKKGKKFSV